jgi:hypothetical protein
LGVLIYELLHGARPFVDPNDKNLRPRSALSSSTSSFIFYIQSQQTPAEAPRADFKMSSRLPQDCKDFLRDILCIEKDKRLGIISNQADSAAAWNVVKSHPFLADINWELVRQRKLDPPIKPRLDVANCSNSAALIDQLVDEAPRKIDPKYQQLFAQWDWNVALHPQPANSTGSNNAPGANSTTAGDNTIPSNNSGQVNAGEPDFSGVTDNLVAENGDKLDHVVSVAPNKPVTAVIEGPEAPLTPKPRDSITEEKKEQIHEETNLGEATAQEKQKDHNSQGDAAGSEGNPTVSEENLVAPPVQVTSVELEEVPPVPPFPSSLA